MAPNDEPCCGTIHWSKMYISNVPLLICRDANVTLPVLDLAEANAETRA